MYKKQQQKKIEVEVAQEESKFKKNYVNFKLIAKVQLLDDSDVNFVFEWIDKEHHEKKVFHDLGCIDHFKEDTEHEIMINNNLQHNETVNPYQNDNANTKNVRSVYDLGQVKVDETFCEAITTNLFSIYFVNVEEKISVYHGEFDYSAILVHNVEQCYDNICYKMTIEDLTGMDKLNIAGLSIEIEASQNLITPIFRQFLNPLLVEVEKITDLFLNQKQLRKYESLYVCYKFLHYKEICTHKIKHQKNVKINHKHVFLIGLLDQTKLKETLASSRFTFEIHDRDHIQKSNVKAERNYVEMKENLESPEEDQKLTNQNKGMKHRMAQHKKPDMKKPLVSDVKKEFKKQKNIGKGNVDMTEIVIPELEKYNKNEIGQSVFSFSLQMNPHELKFSLTSCVYPNKKYIDTERNNQDLNKNARLKSIKLQTSILYMDENTMQKINLDLAFPIDTFDENVFKQLPKDDILFDSPVKADKYKQNALGKNAQPKPGMSPSRVQQMSPTKLKQISPNRLQQYKMGSREDLHDAIYDSGENSNKTQNIFLKNNNDFLIIGLSNKFCKIG